MGARQGKNQGAGQIASLTRFAGRFELLRLLGRGATCSVHAAHDHQLDRLVALKTLLPAPGADDAQRAEMRARFAAEGRRASQLQHPDIVAVLDVGSHEDGAESTAWLAMEAVPGVDLSRYVRAGHLLPEALVLHIGQRLAGALAHAHAADVVHRDIKPANVLAHWPTQTLKLVDFGLARGADSGQSATGLLLGTPAYMAPEQLAGAPPSAHTDLYGLGVLLFELLTARRPHEAASMGELLQRVAQEPATDLRLLTPDLPAALADPLAALLARLLAKRPAQRPVNAAAVADELQALRWAVGFDVPDPGAAEVPLHNAPPT